ncbi:ScbA/BarX family gamma-butyrolactone biosynthesis protein [Streptomyces sp. NPDC048275]|uniref:ScbA/BarX family gamma-butyrolactone biosynthesis protein n=1 Tax=Streptomyces sp. NPDC048275 TaxID=3155629 RepID=UPI0033FC3059
MTPLTIRTTDLVTPRQEPGAMAARAVQAMPRLTTTVPREYVHRASHAEVFLTGCEQLGDGRFALTGQWPRTHTFFTSADGTHHDALQAAETIRQTGLFLAHAEFDVPLGHQFLLRDLHLSTSVQDMVIGPGPSELSLAAVCTDVVRRGRRVSEFRMDITIERAGGRCAAGGGRFACVSEATYRRLRGTASCARPPARAQPHRTLAPAAAGKAVPADVVLCATDRAGRWLLDPDPRHPILFEHAGDHFPGMVLLEAARQAAGALGGPLTLTPTSVRADFHQYAEFGPPVWIEAAPLPADRAGRLSARITGLQQDRAVFTARVDGTLSSPA